MGRCIPHFDKKVKNKIGTVVFAKIKTNFKYIKKTAQRTVFDLWLRWMDSNQRPID